MLLSVLLKSQNLEVIGIPILFLVFLALFVHRKWRFTSLPDSPVGRLWILESLFLPYVRISTTV